MNTDLNQNFLEQVKTSFREFINTAGASSRSTAKLKPLHGAIARDIANKLGKGYKVWSQGYNEGKEKTIQGRYIDKRVDITIENINTKRIVAGIAVKFVMQNYQQNSNNYFENMLGETANIRSGNCPYFQIFIILDKLPYYKRSNEIDRWESFTGHNLKKYNILSGDNPERFLHTPNKTLVSVVRISPPVTSEVANKNSYVEFYTSNMDNLQIEAISPQGVEFLENGTIILNDYNLFIEKVYHTIMSI